jgi:hypothetical protein
VSVEERPGPALPAPVSREPHGMPFALRPVKLLAGAALLTMLLARLVAPAVAGVAVGIDAWIEGIDYVAGLATQILALAASVTAFSQITSVVREPIAILPRVASAVLGGVVVLMALSAAGLRPHAVVLSIIGVCSGAFAVLSAWEAVRWPGARVAGIAVGAAGVSTMVRLAGVALAAHVVEGNQPGAAAWARGVASASFAFDVCLLAAAVSWIALCGRRVAIPVLLGALALAALLTGVAVARPEDPSAWVLLVSRGSERLLARPEPFVPLVVDLFAGIFAVVLALAALLTRSPIPALGGAVALALLVRGSGEVPLFGILLVVAATTLLLGAHVSPASRARPPVRAAPPQGPSEVENSARRH